MRRYGGVPKPWITQNLGEKTLDYPKPWLILLKTLAYFANLGLFCSKPWRILLKTLAYFTQNLGFPVTRTDMGVFGLKPWKTLDYENSGRDRSDCRDSVADLSETLPETLEREAEILQTTPSSSVFVKSEL